MLDLALRTEGPRRRTTRVIVLRTILVAMALLATIATAVAAPSPPLPLKCVAFSPYVAGYNPETGPHPPRALIEHLLDRLIEQTSATCIMTYGVGEQIFRNLPLHNRRRGC